MTTVFFDLDNTIYDSRQYFLGAFKKIADYLAKKYSLPKKKIYNNSVNLWQKKTSFYPYLFNDLLKTLKIKDDQALEPVIKIFNQYKGELIAYSDVISTLRKLKKQGYILGIITDGNIDRQARKIKALGIKSFFKLIVYSKETAEKPSKMPFLAAMEKLKVNSSDCLYLGDNPGIDFKGAKACGFKTARLLRGEFKNLPKDKYIDYEIKKFSEVLNLVK